MTTSISYTYFVGSNNKTKKPEFNKAVKVVQGFNDALAFTLVKDNIGIWKGSKEQSFNICILANRFNPFGDADAVLLKKLLERQLQQEAVLLEKRRTQLL